jgi:glycosyltransferase involved in cell wall biosynthesis
MITSNVQDPTVVANTVADTPVVLPTADTTYLERIETTLDAVEHSAAVIERTPASPEKKRTALAVSVVIPVYNERETIATIVERVRAEGLHHEIIIVDDFSLDGTRDVLLELAREPDVQLLMHGYNRGKGAALRTAFAAAKGDVVLIQDADLEYDPSDYAKLLAPIERGETDVVYGSRFLENASQDPSRLHRFGNWLLTTCSNLFTGQRLTDMETCYKAFRREILSTLTIEQNRFGFEPEITGKISRLGHKIVEVPIGYHARGYEEGKKIGLGDAISALRCIVKYR